MDNLIENFQPQAFNHARMFLILFCGFLAAQVTVNFRDQLRYFKTEPTKIYNLPPRILGFFQLPKLSASQFSFFGIALILSLILAAANFYPRLFLCAALICYFPYFNSIMSLSYVQRKTNLIPIILLILLFAPSINEPFDVQTPIWSILLIKIVIAQMYFSAGLQKLRRAGFRWADGKSLRAFFAESYLSGDTKFALIAARFPFFCVLSSFLILSFELSFWIIVFLPALTYVYIFFAFLFHAGILLTMRINYLKYLSPAYMVFLTDIAFQIKDKLNL